MDSAYLESSVYIAIFNGEEEAKEVQALVREIRKERVKICTSILIVQEKTTPESQNYCIDTNLEHVARIDAGKVEIIRL